MSSNQIATKVCIIGVSPAGLLTANILQKNRIPCILIENKSLSEVSARSKTDLLDYQTVSTLEQHGFGDRLIKEAIPNGKCEFRTPEQSFVLNYADKCQGQTHYSYPQSDLLEDLIKRFEQTGGTILFNVQNIKISNSDRGAWIKCKHNDKIVAISCDFIAGCDGLDGVSRTYIPETIIQPRSKNFNYAWLAVTADVAPSSQHTIYSLHPKGFAGFMPHSKDSTYYLQIPVGDTIAQWSNSRIWSELKLRLAKDGWDLTEGQIVAKQVLKMEQFTPQTMQYCRLFLAGDAAHTISPAGEKNMSLAIQDADILGKAFVSYYRYHDNLPLKNYSIDCLPAIRQMQQFSESLLHMIDVQDSRTLAGKSQQRVQQFKRSQLMNSEIYALDFARKYVGYIQSDRSNLRLARPKRTAKVVEFDLAELPPLKVG